MVKLLIIAIFIIAIAAIAVSNNETAVAYLSAIIAILALLVSALGVFKNEIFPFSLKLFIDELLVPGDTANAQRTDANLPLVLGVSFMNEGYAEGIIEYVFLKVIGEDNIVKIYNPTVEIDYKSYIQGARKLHASNIISQFSSFPMHSKSSVKKYIVFQNLGSEKNPISDWNVGNYKIEIYCKHSSFRQPIKIIEKPFTLDENGLENYKNNNSVQYSLVFIDV